MEEEKKLHKPVLSICIPTYNRYSLLSKCLDSIVCQFADKEIYEKTEIIISDNASPDDTKKIAEKYASEFNNIKYFRNDRNIGNDNTFHVISYASGLYFWVFADDDLHRKNSIRTIINAIETDSPDIIFCNLEMFNEKRKIFGRNILSINEDCLLRGKKDFFRFLSGKFYFSIDWFTTLLSNMVMKKQFFDDNSYIIDKYNSPLNLYPLTYPIYYANNDPLIKIISTPLVLYRQSDVGYGMDTRVKFEMWRHKLLSEHYRNIIRINRKYLPATFIINVYIKKFLRLVKIFLCKFRII